ncbi:MAG: B12-binding domain-containing radical SAM protein [candidate division KSB1 bacterium]|nr:B12-binding domain-containing radical SAM protein [candidate division KSB1 bacterium]MDZ7275889.1 B12-binding domain-containing radical SAM protein [candidate division KSB1 bacterium]MDZ7287639.1 B12-binding domain-containing radical SAM protein [candidate division KSB1 bacterium]MDZ7306801.1 B12-binding domain-containing radical SAM protein [candidate division KSB1 bacterium]MDZ7350617.1 B12-binding domain-containing radical SAM protein [candidate division KSB1 bacterium]
MIDVLLAHSFFLRFDPKQWRAMQPYPPLGTLYAAAYLRARGYRVALFDSMLAESPAALRPMLERYQPRVVVFYEDSFNWLSKMCLTRMRAACFAMIKLAKSLGVPVIVAGSDATDQQPLYFEAGADYVLLGEGEISLAELLDAMLQRRPQPLDQIAGLAFRQNGGITTTASRGVLKELDQLPFPAWDLVDIEAYRHAWRRKHGYFSMNMVTTRGCPFRCNWCAKPIYGDRYNSRSPENVAQEMAWLKRQYQPDHIWFSDDIFGLKPGWVERFARAVHAAGAVIPFKIQARVDLLHEEVVVALKQAGCKTVWVGAESGSQKILEAMDKGTTVAQIYAAAERLHRHGLEVCFFLQFGYPGESDADIAKTIQMVHDCRPDDIGISVSYPLPGTRFYERVQGELGGKRNWEHSNDLDLMFRGRYQPDFYRQLHRVVHQEFRLRKTAALFAEMRRRPALLTPRNLRRVLAAAGRWPLLQLARARLWWLKKPNRVFELEEAGAGGVTQGKRKYAGRSLDSFL